MSLNRAKMAREVADLLGVRKLGRESTSELPYHIVTIIIDTITHSLLKGDPVTILGLGRFTIRTRPATKHGTGNTGETRSFAPKPYIHFQPTQAILRNLNGLHR